MDVRVGPWSRLSTEELTLLNCATGVALESPLDCKEIKPFNSKGNQPWIFIGRTDAEAPVLWPPDAKSRLIGKDPDAGKNWGQEEKRATEDEMVGWYHWLNGREFEQTLRVTEGQGSLVCCSPWGHKLSDTTQQLNNNNSFGSTWLKGTNFYIFQDRIDYDIEMKLPNISGLLNQICFSFMLHAYCELGKRFCS